MAQIGYDLILTVMNQGYSDAAVMAARAVGANGGTVIHVRGAGKEEVEQFLGITIQAEKELVAMVVNREDKQQVMRAISSAVGLKTEAKGVVIALPVSDAIGLA